jgi:hypothetical protein
MAQIYAESKEKIYGALPISETLFKAPFAATNKMVAAFLF